MESTHRELGDTIKSLICPWQAPGGREVPSGVHWLFAWMSTWLDVGDWLSGFARS
jgi:hypothetical protein